MRRRSPFNRGEITHISAPLAVHPMPPNELNFLRPRPSASPGPVTPATATTATSDTHVFTTMRSHARTPTEGSDNTTSTMSTVTAEVTTATRVNMAGVARARTVATGTRTSGRRPAPNALAARDRESATTVEPQSRPPAPNRELPDVPTSPTSNADYGRDFEPAPPRQHAPTPRHPGPARYTFPHAITYTPSTPPAPLIQPQPRRTHHPQLSPGLPPVGGRSPHRSATPREDWAAERIFRLETGQRTAAASGGAPRSAPPLVTDFPEHEELLWSSTSTSAVVDDNDSPRRRNLSAPTSSRDDPPPQLLFPLPPPRPGTPHPSVLQTATRTATRAGSTQYLDPVTPSVTPLPIPTPVTGGQTGMRTSADPTANVLAPPPPEHNLVHLGPRVVAVNSLLGNLRSRCALLGLSIHEILSGLQTMPITDREFQSMSGPVSQLENAVRQAVPAIHSAVALYQTAADVHQHPVPSTLQENMNRLAGLVSAFPAPSPSQPLPTPSPTAANSRAVSPAAAPTAAAPSGHVFSPLMDHVGEQPRFPPTSRQPDTQAPPVTSRPTAAASETRPTLSQPSSTVLSMLGLDGDDQVTASFRRAFMDQHRCISPLAVPAPLNLAGYRVLSVAVLRLLAQTFDFTVPQQFTVPLLNIIEAGLAASRRERRIFQRALEQHLYTNILRPRDPRAEMPRFHWDVAVWCASTLLAAPLGSWATLDFGDIMTRHWRSLRQGLVWSRTDQDLADWAAWAT